MAGHIKLGLTADTLQDYMLDDVRRRRRQLANSMAPRLATGGEFNDYENWSLHAPSDWREGVGKRAEDAAGFLYGEIESRVPEQLILPAALGCSPVLLNSLGEDDLCSYMPAQATEYTVLTVTSPERVAMTIQLYGGASTPAIINGIAILVDAPDSSTVSIEVWTDSAGVPDTMLDAESVTVNRTRPGYEWIYAPNFTFRAAPDELKTLHIVVYPSSGAISLPMGNNYASTSNLYDGSSWATDADQCPFFVVNQPNGGTSVFYSTAGVNGFFISDNQIYANMFIEYGPTGNAANYVLPVKYNSSTERWEYLTLTGTVGSYGTYPVSEFYPPVVFDGVAYFPQASQYTTVNLTSLVGATSTDDAHIFGSWSGYLWRAYNNQLWYANDGATWVEVTGGIGGSDYRIRGLAGLGVNMYVCTDEALYSIYPGDVVVGIFPWGTISEDNGRGMIAHQGALYIPAQGRLWQYKEDGTLTDIWISRDDDLNARRMGRISSLASLNNMLVAGVDGTTSSDPSSVWAYTGLGWHHLATLPPGYKIRSVYYDRIRSVLWIASDDWAIFYIYAPDWALNPYNDSSNSYMPHGWMETDRLYLGSRDLFKDAESVRVYGDFETGADVVVYWRDQDSTDWELLGTVDADGEEVRWSTVSTRPATRWIRVGLLFRTDDPAFTARVRAWALKAMPMIRDRWRWDIVIDVADNQQMIGGQMDDRYADDKRDAIEDLVESVAPVLFEDVDGRQYWVKILSAGESLDNYENDGYGTVQYSMKFSLSLEQIQSVF